MRQLSKILIGVAVICVIVSLILKVAVSGGTGVISPGSMIWLKFGGLCLLFSIAIALSLIAEKK